MAALFNVTFNTTCVPRLAAFWAAALDMHPLEERDDLVRLAAQRNDAPNLLVLRSDNPSTSTGRVHIDLATADVVAEAQRLKSLGATLADGGLVSSPPTRSANGLSWIVMLDPDGNEFCLGDIPEAQPN